MRCFARILRMAVPFAAFAIGGCLIGPLNCAALYVSSDRASWPVAGGAVRPAKTPPAE